LSWGSLDVWVPGLVVLAVGIGAGWWLALRLRRSGPAPPQGDLALRIADLEARREELYKRLRSKKLTEGERPALELAAARVLRDLDRARTALPSGEVPATSGESEASPAGAASGADAAPAAAGWGSGRRSGLVGFVAGVAAAALVGLLVYWAGRDAAPSSQDGGPMQAPSGAGGELPPDHPALDSQASVQQSEEIAALGRRVEADPGDLMAMKQLSLAQLSAGSYVDAFQTAGRLLQTDAEDPDGLFVQGVVRLAMGQNAEAVVLFDRVLAQYPDHLQAIAYRGLGLYQGGEVERAVDTWEMGKEIAGGDAPQFEALLEMARTGEAPPGMTGEPPPDHPPIASAPGAPPAPRNAAEAPPVSVASGPVYRARIELPAGVRVATGAVLFVALRGSGGGPPAAVRRIDAPAFPLELELSSQDSMMGAELPESGLLTARLDFDGSASTRTAGDLAAEAEMSIGQSVTLVLGPQ
jgi:tetratricopeptide (TPR) repeat protein